MNVLNIIHYQNHVNHIQYHPAQKTIWTVSELTIFSKKPKNHRFKYQGQLAFFSGKMIEKIGFYHYDSD